MEIRFIARTQYLTTMMGIILATCENGRTFVVISKSGEINVGDTQIGFVNYPIGIFSGWLYEEKIFNLLKILSKLSEQPISLLITDSETFNIKITEAYV